MRFVVLGAGAVGGTVGGRLADTGHDVVFLARGEHARVMREHGLRLATPERVITVRSPVAELHELELHDGDVLLLATKTQQTVGVLDALTRRDLPVLCIQNGVTNERMAARRGFPTYGVVVMLPAAFLEPGRIDAQGSPYSGLLDIGRWPRGCDDTATTVADALSRSGFVSRAVDDVMRWKYAKLLRNVGNAIQAICGADADGAELDAVRDLDALARSEAEACLDAAGIAWVPDDEWNERRQKQVQWTPVEGRGRSGGSTWQSVVRGRDVEVDYLNGEIVLLGRMHRVATPVNELLQREAHALARTGGAPGAVRAQDLLAQLAR